MNILRRFLLIPLTMVLFSIGMMSFIAAIILWPVVWVLTGRNTLGMWEEEVLWGADQLENLFP